MKKYLVAILMLSISLVGIAQGRFSASLTNVNNVLTFKLKPIGANITAGISTIEFFVRYPNPGTPSFNYGTVSVNTTNFPGMTSIGTLASGSWEIERNNAAYALPGFLVDHFIYTAPAPATTSQTYIMNTEYNIISVPLSGSGTANLQFIHQNTEDKYYLAITDAVGGDLRPAAFANYFYPTTASTSGPSGSTFYSMGLSNVPLPIKFNDFTATKKANDGILNWSAENETNLTATYEIERSFNGVDFKKFETVAPKNNGLSSNDYTLTDFNLSSLKSAGVIYYRIKQIDVDGKFVYSVIRSLVIEPSKSLISVSPNPVTDITAVRFNLEKDEIISILLTDASGKQIQQLQVLGVKGLNNKTINMASLPNGTYQLIVKTSGEIKTTTVVKIN